MVFLLSLAMLVGACGGGGSTTCEFPTPKSCDGKCAECCSDTDCGTNGTCSNGVCQCKTGFEQKCSADLMCVQCCETSQCSDAACPGKVTCDKGKCKNLGIIEDGDCFNDPTGCCPGLSCDVFTNTCQPECKGDADCQKLDVPFADDMSCKNGVCDFAHCTKDANCAGGKVCYNGNCVTIPGCDDLGSCQIVPATAVTQQNTKVKLAASAYFKSGALAPGVGFSWQSNDTNIAAISATGEVTGGANSGVAEIKATISGCSITCTASVRNYGAVTSGSRVVVLSELEQTPIEGATVVAGSETVTTNQNGEALLTTDLSTTAADVSIFHPQYHYLTLRGVNTKDVLAALGKLYQYDFSKNPPQEVAGGIRGKFDYGQVLCHETGSCDVTFGLGGLSIPGNLVNLNFDLLIGGMVKSKIDLGSQKYEVALPAGLTVGVSNLEGKAYYTPTGIPGKRAAWGIGGRLVLSDLFGILSPVISGGEIEVGKILVALLPKFANFYTSIIPNLDIVPKPMVTDVNDINDNDKTDDLVPDYDNFPNHGMKLTIRTDQTMTFKIGTLPSKPAGGFWYDGVIVLAGVIAKDQGLIPLGLSAGVDVKDKEAPDGKIDDITLNCADVAGRIPEDQIKRVVVVLALNMSGLMGDNNEGLSLGGVVKFVDEFKGTHEISGFITPPASATYNATERKLTVSGIPSGVTVNQVIFTGNNDANWSVMGVFGDGDYTLPAAPQSGDRAKNAKFISMKLNTVDYQGLLKFDENNLTRMIELVDSFSFFEIK